MPRFAALALAVLTTAVAVAQEPKVDLVAPTGPLSPADQQKGFHLPPGYSIELVAAEPEIRKPMNLSFDAAGRMWVSQSIEYPFPAKEGEKPRDTIRVFADTNGDGMPDKVSVFAEGLNIPIGLLPVHDGVLGYSIPTIDKFRDTDGDGKADERKPLYGTFGFDDTHGMASSFTWGLDGWVYATHGFRNTSKVKGADGHEITMNSGNTYRFRIDGSHIEQWTWGQVNPFGLAFDELGNLYSADCHSKPLTMLLRNGYYQSFGKPDDGLGFAPDMIAHSHNSTGICGVVWYQADHFPKDQQQTVFICNPVTGRINHDRFGEHGSSYMAVELPDFLTCDDPWFRPVDIKLGPDGALYIADFYNKIIGHYEVPLLHPERDRERGRIWRVTFTGKDAKKPVPMADLSKASTDDLIATLGSPSILARTLATHQLVHRVGEPAVKPLTAILKGEASGSEHQRAHGLWVLDRLGQLSKDLIAALARDKSRLVRTHLAKALAERREWPADLSAIALTLAKDPDAFARRAAADALGRHPHPDNIPALLSVWTEADQGDSQLVHVARIALRDTLLGTGTSKIAADLLKNDEAARKLAGIALGLRNSDGASFLLTVLDRPGLNFDIGQQARFLHHFARFSDESSLPEAVRRGLERRKLDLGGQLEVLRSLERGFQERGAKIPSAIRSWQAELSAELLASNAENALRQGLDVTREFRVQQSIPRVLQLAMMYPAVEVRLQACDCLATLDGGQAVPILKMLLADGAQEIRIRQRAADILAGINSPQSRETLLSGLLVTPTSVQLSIARGLAGTPEGAEPLLKAVAEGKTTARVLQDQVVSEKLKGTKLKDIETRLAELTKDLPAEDERLQKLIADRQGSYGQAKPDAAKGLAIFTKACAGCHKLENKGTKVGPDLDGIGQRGLERILEDILMPSRNVDQAFRATAIALKDGTSVTGLVQREEGEVLIVVNDQAKEVRIPKADIDEKRLLRLSPMPANVAEQLSPEDFHHLMGYLLSQKMAPEKK